MRAEGSAPPQPIGRSTVVAPLLGLRAQSVKNFRGVVRKLRAPSFGPAIEFRGAGGGETVEERAAAEIRGALEYQACDDNLCFLPKTVPVSYTVQLRPLDTQRADVPGQR